MCMCVDCSHRQSMDVGEDSDKEKEISSLAGYVSNCLDIIETFAYVFDKYPNLVC